MSQSPDQLLLYRIEQVEREMSKKVGSRELGLQLAPLHREVTDIKDQLAQFRQEQAERDKQRRAKEVQQMTWLVRGLWAFVVAILGFASSVVLIVIQHWIG